MRASHGDALDRAFFWTLLAKGANGVLEVIAGIALLMVDPAAVRRLVERLTREELTEDPADVVANLIVHRTDHLSLATLHFGSAYLLVHGVVKAVLVVAVLRGRLWAYPWLIGVLVAFIGYQCLEMTRHATLGMALLTAFDAVIVALTWVEYRRRRHGVHAPAAPGSAP